MEWITSESPVAAERAPAEFIARHLNQVVRRRGQALLAISGGLGPWGMFDQLAAQAVTWDAVHLFQVDERIAPLDDVARNWKQFLASALARRTVRGIARPVGRRAACAGPGASGHRCGWTHGVAVC